LAGRIQSAEKFAPNATNQMEAKWIFSGILPSPNTQIPMKVDSAKKASKASRASGTPKMSPTKRENAD
jgi:hypothetical protein